MIKLYLNTKLFVSVALLLGTASICVSEQYWDSLEIYHEGWIDFNKNGRMDVFEDPRADIDDRIDDLLSQMTLDEKTAQMVTLYGWGRVLEDEFPTEAWKESSWKDGIANIDEQANFPFGGKHTEAAAHVEFIRLHQRWFVENTRLGIPVDFTNEGIRGLCHDHVTSFPTQLGRGATFNRELEYDIARITALEAKAVGYSNVYSPILDVLQDPRWGRNLDVYGESPYLVGELGLQHVLGLQDQGIVSTPKHYAVYSAPYGGKNTVRGDVQVTFRNMHEIHMEPFRKAFAEGGALGVMSAYSIYDGDSTTGSHYFLTELLRDTYGFKGYVVSDSGAVAFMHAMHKQTATWKESIAKAVNAGLNVRTNFRDPGHFLDPLREAVKEGLISEETIDARVRDVLYVKFWMGLFDDPYIGLDNAPELIRTPEARRLAVQAARESIVLMRNEGSILPINAADYPRILVTGPSANDTSIMRFHYGPHRAEIITPLEGIRNAFKGKSQINYVKGSDFIGAQFPESDILRNYKPTDEERAKMDEAVAKAAENDLIIAFMGDSGATVGESFSRSELTLPRLQETYLQQLVDTGKPVILFLLNGRPIVLNDVQDNVPAILSAFFGGEAAGTAIADVLTGNYNPGGRLPYTTPKTVGQLPLTIPYRHYSWNDGGSAYVDRPQFYFGHGLSYTTFAYDDLNIQTAGRGDAGKITVSFTVKNTGRRAGDVVPQLYVRQTVASVSPYYKQLRGFDRVHLAAGEERTVTMTLQAFRDLKMMNLDNEWVVEPGIFEIMIADSYEDSQTKLNQAIQLTEEGEWLSESVLESSRGLVELATRPGWQGGNRPENVLDGDRETRWATDEANPVLTFRVLREFNQLGFVWYLGENRRYPFEVEISDDGETWTEIYRGEGGGTRFEDFHRLPEFNSSFIRIRFHGNDQNAFTSIHNISFSDQMQL
jgi:beta-glucosidase